MPRIWLHTLFLTGTSLADRSEMQIDEPSAVPLLDLLRKAVGEDEGVLFNIIDEREKLRPHIAVFINSTNCRDLQELETEISRDDEVLVFPALSGG